MQLSDMPELMRARGKLAREIHDRRGGDYIAAVEEANAVVRRCYKAARARSGVTETQAPAAHVVREAASLTVREGQRMLVSSAQSPTAAKPQKAKRAKTSAVSEADLARKVDLAITEALARSRLSPGSAPATRTLRELTGPELAALGEAELAAALDEASCSVLTSPFTRVTEAGPGRVAEAAPPAADTASQPLHRLDWETGDAVMGGVFASYGSGLGLRSPFWRN